jgi:hypothetical protein
MKVIDTKTHGYLDYLMGTLLIASPWIFDFYRAGVESWVPMILGAGTILYSLFTNYEMGLVKSLSMKTHLGLDYLAGALLAASPWIFGFADFVFWPHLILGVLELLATSMTQMEPKMYRAENKEEYSQ